MAITTNKLFHLLLLARSRRLSFLRSSPLISLFCSLQNLSTLAQPNHNPTVHTHSSNPFAEFATTKLNLSSADIARMLKNNPSLERLKTLEKVEQFVELLKKYGCSQLQIASIMKRRPSCLNVCPERVIEPKIQLLRDLGIQGEDLVKVLARKPSLLGTSLQNTLLPNAAFLELIFKNRDLFIKAILRQPLILTYDLERYVKPSVAFFEECGLVGEQFTKSIVSRPRLLLCSCLTPAQAELLQKIGVDKGSKMYKHVLTMVIISRLETLEAKIENFQQCGLTAEEIFNLFRVCPYVFCLSVGNVRQKMDFIVNDMKLPANSVLKQQYLFQDSLKVVKPRFLVLKRIQTLNDLDHLKIRGLSSILEMSEAKFVNTIVEGNPKSRLLNEIYQEALTDVSPKAKTGTMEKNIWKPWCF